MGQVARLGYSQVLEDRVACWVLWCGRELKLPSFEGEAAGLYLEDTFVRGQAQDGGLRHRLVCSGPGVAQGGWAWMGLWAWMAEERQVAQ
ncbi:hypothetical protein JX265_012439 [Neoarthrinium moseri]|uniref:Uncharacterized protein n=1 Tax=Neoarthrinium moseri TaxID=1658444 RepID=A0A9P9WAP6_9PEZI|nr:hypothetical protein JX265_012439 [Neoarthrinium moseri]